MPLTPVQARQRARENMLRHAVGMVALVTVLGVGYIIASTIVYRATVAIHNAVLGHDHQP